MIARDWLRTLFDASFKGVPFFVETDAEEGGRRVAVHQFPFRDDPYLEDMGEDKRGFSVTAYVASDAADSEAAGVVSVCAEPGAGTLVLPTHGPINARCITFKRNRSKDKHGKIAIELTFIREGLAQASPSELSLANMVFVQADGLTAALADFAGKVIDVKGRPDYVVGAAVSTIQDAAASFEAIRTSAPVAVDVSAAQRAPIEQLYNAAPVLASRLTGADPVIGSTIAAIARALGDGFDAPAARGAFLPLLDMFAAEDVPSGGTVNAQLAVSNANAVRLIVRLAALSVCAESVARDASITDRPTGISLRADLTELFDAQIETLETAYV